MLLHHDVREHYSKPLPTVEGCTGIYASLSETDLDKRSGHSNKTLPPCGSWEEALSALLLPQSHGQFFAPTPTNVETLADPLDVLDRRLALEQESMKKILVAAQISAVGNNLITPPYFYFGLKVRYPDAQVDVLSPHSAQDMIGCEIEGISFIPYDPEAGLQYISAALEDDYDLGISLFTKMGVIRDADYLRTFREHVSFPIFIEFGKYPLNRTFSVLDEGLYLNTPYEEYGSVNEYQVYREIAGTTHR